MRTSTYMRIPNRQKLLTRMGVLTRAMTLGVRGLVQDRDGGILLVRHTYVSGWFLPGGGVEPGESLQQALVREVDEEGGVLVDAPPRLFGVYHNRRASPRDHVALYVVTLFHLRAAFQPPRLEIAESRFYLPEALPADTTPATHRRLAEVFNGVVPSEEW